MQSKLTSGARGSSKRRYPVGAEIVNGVTSFRIWAPNHPTASIVLGSGMEYPMYREEDGYFSLEVDALETGTLYQIRLGDEPECLPDPASRFQPEGPSGPSMLVDSSSYQWQATDWLGVSPNGQVLYEMHIGTFTPEGTYAAAAGKLPLLKDLGITCLELMPLNEFLGEFGWGYDGVLPYAPTRLYGHPDELRSFIDSAHQSGIGVILDVVYNHFGVGEKFSAFSTDYFTDRYFNEWGSSVNFDGENCQGVREFISKNAAYWIDEYHLDGLRLDATQALFDASTEHVVTLISREARAAGGRRSIYLLAENEPQDTGLLRAIEEEGMGLNAAWNDDFHHSAMVAATGKMEAYYHDHRGHAQEFISAAKYGYLFQGQRYDWQNAPRGTPGFHLHPECFVHFLQNHDQIANSARGLRVNQLTSPARLRALTALLLLGPQTPMLFQGQEFGATTPFYYFADSRGEMIDQVRRGRIEFLKQFPSLKDPDFENNMPLPSDRLTFERSKLKWDEYVANEHLVALHRDLLVLRRDNIFGGQKGRRAVDGSILDRSALLLRFFADNPEEQRLLLVNLGHDLSIHSRPDPLLAPPRDCQWNVEWSSEDMNYGGSGRRPMDLQHRWGLPADCAVVLAPRRQARNKTPPPEDLDRWQEAISS
ncbi:malto-oligosyltrehalose trehalohydrolase [Rhizobium grahamii]|uniref:Malto-oligosyltrehalose trehalohydrolase n=1 Tax=Rhizobium grahamii TaxID=1120045 RepID=A0A370KF87_9HYPH|nr:malto-oligosyltrehalose trehalohydrolase [Rhizobium grahamii]RDJ02993.1 malto-oligosyltrehalose trehalohydrolase [Rhizobium grahamii]